MQHIADVCLYSDRLNSLNLPTGKSPEGLTNLSLPVLNESCRFPVIIDLFPSNTPVIIRL